jgi:hypothetical protein
MFSSHTSMNELDKNGNRKGEMRSGGLSLHSLTPRDSLPYRNDSCQLFNFFFHVLIYLILGHSMQVGQGRGQWNKLGS